MVELYCFIYLSDHSVVVVVVLRVLHVVLGSLFSFKFLFKFFEHIIFWVV